MFQRIYEYFEEYPIEDYPDLNAEPDDYPTRFTSRTRSAAWITGTASL